MSDNKIWCVVPAAGVGQRMAADIPKQYLPLQNATILDITLHRLQASKEIDEIVIAINPNDQRWQQQYAPLYPDIHTVTGGSSRADSVLNAIQWIKSQTTSNDWVLVHDAARPCITSSDISKLLELTSTDAIGGLLATAMTDTVKQASAGKVDATLQRDSLWRAFTPQLFKIDLLEKALTAAKNNSIDVTDESSAIEQLGFQPVIVQGRADNIKITSAVDLQMANYIINQQQSEICE